MTDELPVENIDHEHSHDHGEHTHIHAEPDIQDQKQVKRDDVFEVKPEELKDKTDEEKKKHKKKFEDKGYGDSAEHIQFKYHCERCSGTAFYASEKIKFGKKLCDSCGQEVECKEENYIAI